MASFEGRFLAIAPVCVDLLIAAVIAFHAGKALWAIVRGRGVDAARLIVAEGVLAGLGFSMAGSLLKTIALEDLASIRNFAFIFLFRTLLKRVFQREQKLAHARRGPYAGPLDASHAATKAQALSTR